MKAIKVVLNGEPVTVAGANDLQVLGAIINVFPQRQKTGWKAADYAVSGLTTDRVHKHWVELEELKVGDEVKFEIVETDEADVPTKKQNNGGSEF